MSLRRAKTVDEPVSAVADEIPFHPLLKPINETHRRGLEVDHNDA